MGKAETKRVQTPEPLLLFVCSANTCRSPMAAAIAARQAQTRAVALRVASAGTATKAGYPAAEHAQQALAEIGLSLADHRSLPLTRDMINEATLVVAATARHRDMLRQFFAAEAAKIRSFGDLTDGGDLSDPIGGDLSAFRQTRDLLCAHMPRIIASLQRQGPALQPREPAR